MSGMAAALDVPGGFYVQLGIEPTVYECLASTLWTELHALPQLLSFSRAIHSFIGQRCLLPWTNYM